MDKLDMDTIERILQLMNDNKISNTQMQNICGISKNVISQWKSGRQKPSADILHKIADYFNVSVDYLLCRTDIKKPTLNNVSFDEFINALNDKSITENDLQNLTKEQYLTIADIIKNFKK